MRQWRKIIVSSLTAMQCLFSELVIVSNKPKVDVFTFYIFSFSIIIILYLSFTPGSVPGSETFGDKFLHSGAFLWLFLVGGIVYKNSVMKLAAALILLGISIEAFQFFLPWREFSFWDIAADLLGIFLGSLLLPFSTILYRRIFNFTSPRLK